MNGAVPSSGWTPAGDERTRAALSRRAFLGRTGFGVGSLALAALLAEETAAQEIAPAGDRPMVPKPTHHAPRARSVIYLGQIGAPSQLDLFEHKPKLRQMDGEPVPDSLIAGERFAFLGAGKAQLLASPWRGSVFGANGTFLSELLPHHRAIVDEVTFVHSMHTDEINHVPAQLLLQTGSPRMGRPAIGSWVTYGIGNASRDLPGFVVLASGKAGRCGTSCWGSGFLPTLYQGVQLRSQGDAALFLSDPPGLSKALRRASLDTLRRLNERRLAAVLDPEIATRIAAYEMAFRMQTSVPELMDVSAEDPRTLALYGAEPGASSFANNCLLARRLVERGVRFVQLVHGGWDHHGGGGDQNLLTDLPNRARQVDRASAALVLDLKQRGLLDDTLVIWGGEFGRTPMLQGERSKAVLGRDHLRTAFTVWLSGGGVRKGHHHGRTDDFGMHAVEDAVHVHDLQATILHLLGLDHERLTFRFQGRQFRLTDVAGEVVRGVLA